MYDAWAGMRRTSMRYRELIQSIRPGLYILIIIGAVCAHYVYKLRHDGIFACQAQGYGTDSFLAECTAPAYGDYEHGAYWFGLEPSALDAVGHAEAVFLGDSRIGVAFSSAATADWFSRTSAKYYVLGFGYRENVTFIQDLLRKIKLHAKVYIINAESFFERKETPPANFVMHDPTAETWYTVKGMMQSVHKPVCTAAPGLCGHNPVVFRSRSTGAFGVSGRRLTPTTITYDREVDHAVVTERTASAREFISSLHVDPECVILTSIPHGITNIELTGTKIANAKAIAANLGMTFIAPELDGLETFDTSHLDHASAQRWSRAFFEAAGPQIRKCLGKDKSSAHNPS